MPEIDNKSAQYEEKVKRYFLGDWRFNYVDQLPLDPAQKILEVGCGTGAQGANALAEKRCSEYHGLEVSEYAGNIAREKLTFMVVGDVERDSSFEQWPDAYFDAVIISEVLEHLVAPWDALRRIQRVMKPNAIIFASSPNVSHHSTLRMMLRNEWDLKEYGIMDRTHLRWFTPNSYRKMFEEAGFAVDSVRPLWPLSWKQRLFCRLTADRFQHLVMTQIDLRAHKPP